MAILEALANGIPCVGVSEKGIPDLVIDGANGLVVPNHDKEAFSRAVLKILDCKDFKHSLRMGALRDIKRHSLGAVIELWEKTYRGVMEN
jgi:glycosyltransferase involved in cell wall biosynthesis